MDITTLDRDMNLNTITAFWGCNGDVYVRIFDQENEESLRTPHTVRLGMAGSGHRLPKRILDAFAELASAFEEYSDCSNEFEAQRKDFDKFLKEEMNNE